MGSKPAGLFTGPVPLFPNLGARGLRTETEISGLAGSRTQNFTGPRASILETPGPGFA